MECNGTTYVGTLADGLGTIRYVFCDACRTIAAYAWDGRRRRRSWGTTTLDPKPVCPRAAVRGDPGILERLPPPLVHIRGLRPSGPAGRGRARFDLRWTVMAFYHQNI